MLKLFVEDIEGLDEAIKPLYVKKGDGYYLKIEGFDPEENKKLKAKVDEFRDNNIKLSKRTEELEKKFADFDPDKYKELMEKERKIKEKDLLEKGDIDQLLQEKTSTMRKDYDAKIDNLSNLLKEANTKLTSSQQRLEKELIESNIVRAASSSGTLRKGALQHILNLGRGVWKLDEAGKPIAQDDNGRPLYGKNGVDHITWEEWAESLKMDYPYLYEGAEGGGSGGGASQSGGVGGYTADQLAKMDPSDRLRVIRGQEAKSEGKK